MSPPVAQSGNNLLTPQQEEAARLRSIGVSITKTAERLGVCKRTVQRWLADPLVSQVIDGYRYQRREVASGLLHKAVPLVVWKATQMTRDDGDRKTQLAAMKILATMFADERRMEVEKTVRELQQAYLKMAETSRPAVSNINIIPAKRQPKADNGDGELNPGEPNESPGLKDSVDMPQNGESNGREPEENGPAPGG